MASSVIRLNGNGILRFLSPPSFVRRVRMLSAAMSSSANPSPSKTSASPSPWLMLPPKAGDNMVYKLYNLSDYRVRSLKAELPDFNNDTVLVGSSHGWLAFFNRRNNHLFLTNPISGRRLNLPPIDAIPNPEITLRDCCGTATKLMLPCSPVSKLILSCSPEHDHDCRAMVTFGPSDRLAFCSPGHSAHWTPIGDLLFPGKYYVDLDKDKDNNDLFYYARPYEDFVYCNRRKLFSCITQFWIDLHCWRPGSQFEINLNPLNPGGDQTHLEDWDLHVDPPRSTICNWLSRLKIHGGEQCSWLRENETLLLSCTQIPYLVFDEQSNDNQLPFIVIRFVVNDDKTVGFSVLKVESEDKLRIVDSLDGIAVFVGMNHTFAVSSAAELGLKPNSIYFTDAAKTRLTPPTYHGDIGIFDYGNKTVSSCLGPSYSYFSRDDETLSTPIWFTPSDH